MSALDFPVIQGALIVVETLSVLSWLHKPKHLGPLLKMVKSGGRTFPCLEIKKAMY